MMRALLAALLLGGGCGASLGDPPGGGAGSDRGSPLSCDHVDILLAVDNSGSTPKEQQALRDGFPGFVSALRDTGIGDFRVGLVDGCAQSANLHTTGMTGPCNFAGGRPWIESSSPNLVSELTCVANIDSRDAQCQGNDNEQPVSTAAAALEPTWSGAGKPNAGFARADALLVVIALTDEDEHPIPNLSAQQIHDRLVAGKGNADKIAFTGFGGESDCDGPYGSAEDADKLHDIEHLFEARGRGEFWDLCGGKLEQGLLDTAAMIDAVCD